MEASIEIAARSNYVFEGARDNDVVIFANNTSQRILIGASNTVATAAPISISATNVGIGTIPSSTYKLDVGGDIRASNVTATRFYGDGSGLTGLTGVDASGGPTVWKSAYINGESNATFSGKVGINTDTPGTNLDVVGDMTVSGSLALSSRLKLSGIRLEKNTTGAMANVTASSPLIAEGVQVTSASNMLIFPKGQGGIYSSNATVTVQDANHNTVFQVSALGTNTQQMAMFSNVEFTGSLTHNGLPFTSGTSGGGGQGWSNNLSGSVYSFSNVGIHTSTPQYGLDVNADVRFNSNMYFNNKIGMRGLRLDKRIPGANTANLTSMNIVGFSNLNSNVSIQTTGTDSTNFIAINSSQTNVETARFTNEGFVGIGTSSPSSKLDVVGTVKATTFSGSGQYLTNVPISALPEASTLSKGIVKLDTSLTSTDTSTVATSSTVKSLNDSLSVTNDVAVAALQRTGGTMAGTITMGANNITGTTNIVSAGTFTGTLFSGSGANLTSIPSTAITTNPTFTGTTTMSNVMIIGSLTACNINSVLETVTIKATQIVQSNLNVYDSIAFGSNIPSDTLASQVETLKVFGPTGIYTSSGETVLYANNAGQIGVGTSAPSFALDLGTAAGQTVRANLFSGSGASVTSLNAGNISTGLLPMARGGLGIGTATGTTGTGNVVLSANSILTGNIGIGTSNPTTNLDVVGTARVSSKLGIGTGTPAYPLHVTNRGGQLSVSAYYINKDLTTIQSTNILGAVTAYIDGDLLVTAALASSSDLRLKNIVSNSLDIDTTIDQINNIDVVKYTYKDYKRGTNTRIGFVAQNIDIVLPDQVKKNIEFLPNIMRIAENVDGVSITLSSHELHIGDILKIIDVTGDEHIVNVYQVTSENVFTIDKCITTTKMFLYGTQHDDVLSVDYNSVFALGFNGIKSLLSMHKELDLRVSAMNEKINTLENIVNQLCINR